MIPSTTSTSLNIESYSSIPEIQHFSKMGPMLDKLDDIQERGNCQLCSKHLVIDDDNFNILAIELLLSSMEESNID